MANFDGDATMTPTPSAAPAEPSDEELNRLADRTISVRGETSNEWRRRFARAILALRAPDAPKGEPTAEPSLNQWFLALPKGRQSVLVDDKWMLAEAAYQAGKALASKGKATATDAEIVKVYRDACEYADKLQQGFSWGRMQALRAVFDMGRAAQPSPTMADATPTNACNGCKTPAICREHSYTLCNVLPMADATAAGEPTAAESWNWNDPEAVASLADVVDDPVEMWHGDRKITIYRDTVLRVWGARIEDEMSDEPRTAQSVQSAFEWLASSAGTPHGEPTCKWCHGSGLDGDEGRETVCLNCRGAGTPHGAREPMTVQDVMFEVFEYAKISDGIDGTWGDARDDKRALMLTQDRKIRKMLAALACEAREPADAKDAARYRWLRAQDNEDFEFAVVRNPHFDVFDSPEALDAAIDAGIGQSAKEKQ